MTPHDSDPFEGIPCGLCNDVALYQELRARVKKVSGVVTQVTEPWCICGSCGAESQAPATRMRTVEMPDFPSQATE